MKRTYQVTVEEDDGSATAEETADFIHDLLEADFNSVEVKYAPPLSEVKSLADAAIQQPKTP